jgi:hypothetical protein
MTLRADVHLTSTASRFRCQRSFQVKFSASLSLFRVLRMQTLTTEYKFDRIYHKQERSTRSPHNDCHDAPSRLAQATALRRLLRLGALCRGLGVFDTKNLLSYSILETSVLSS